MFSNLKRSAGLGLVVIAAAAGLGAYAFTTSNTVDTTSAGGVGQATIAGYDVSNVSYTQDATDPSTWSAVDFDLDSNATQVQVKFDDSNNVLPSSGWIDCSANGSTISHTTPFAVHCVLPGVDAHLDTLTVSAAR
ncbi:MAG TPA: hypothetical protein VFX13_16330 [Gaiellales bacterium]|jgi:hypothetical protein|nr:hypothetical protein [Gaiellales bacterium]